MPNNSNVLVTGANGFIASQLTSELKKKGAFIRGLDISQGPYSNCDESIQCDLTDLSKCETVLAKACRNIDVIYHLAGKVHSLSEVHSDRAEYWKINVDASNKLLNTAKTSNVSKFVFFSSVKVFGEYQTGNNHNPLSEQDTPEPDTPYGETKFEFEKTLLNNSGSTTPIVLRLAMVYGPNSKGNLIKMINAVKRGIPFLLPDFNNKRSMVDVRDVIRVAVLAFDSDKMRGIYQVTDGLTYSTEQTLDYIYAALGKKRTSFRLPKWLFISSAMLCDVIEKALGHRIMFDSDKLNKLAGDAFFSSERLKKELNFVPEWNLEKSLFYEYNK